MANFRNVIQWFLARQRELGRRVGLARVTEWASPRVWYMLGRLCTIISHLDPVYIKQDR